VSGDQQDSLDSAGQLGPEAFNLDVQLCKHGNATVLIEFLNNRLTLREITKKITKNFQLPKKSEKSRNITKSNLNYQIWSH
jgi:hypothetical protein